MKIPATCASGVINARHHRKIRSPPKMQHNINQGRSNKMLVTKCSGRERESARVQFRKRWTISCGQIITFWPTRATLAVGINGRTAFPLTPGECRHFRSMFTRDENPGQNVCPNDFCRACFAKRSSKVIAVILQIAARREIRRIVCRSNE